MRLAARSDRSPGPMPDVRPTEARVRDAILLESPV